MRPLATALASVLLITACDDKKEESGDETPSTPDKPAGEDGSPPVPPTAPPPVNVSPELKGAMELPSAVPAGAAGVLMVRVPDSLFASAMNADPLGLAKGDLEALEKEIDEYLIKQIGITMTDATAVAAFFLGEKDFGVVLVGVEGEVKGTKTGSHQGADLLQLPGGSEMRVATKDDVLVLGSETSVKAALDAQADEAKSAAKADALGKLFASETDGVAVAIGVDINLAPEKMRRDLPKGMKLDRGFVTFGDRGLRLLLEGDETSLNQVSALITMGLSTALAEMEKQKERATKKEDPGEIVEGVAAIMGTYYMQQAQNMLTPKIEGKQLTIEVPMSAGDPAILAALVGMSAAIAIPAFTKYMRRSKTSEARVQLAKMFDAASAYFNEEHVDRGAVAIIGGGGPTDVTPHKCPNNGKLVGESGVTPPLSVDCNEGPGGRCVPSVGGSGGPGYYDISAWTDNDVWNGLNFQMEQAHYFHYNFKWANTDGEFGECQFTAQAFGDLDGDGVFSTYERSGAADMHGVNAAAGLYIDRETE